MQFELQTACGSSPWEGALGTVLFLAPFISVYLILWLGLSPRDPRDVLHAGPALPVSSSRRLAEFAAWALPTATLLLWLLAGMGLLYAFLFLDLVDWMRGSGESGVLAGQGFDLLPREAVLVSLAVGACLVLWRQLRPSERDVLGVSTRA